MPPTTTTIIQIGRLSTDAVGESAPGAAPWSDAASDVVGAAGVGSTSGEATAAGGGGPSCGPAASAENGGLDGGGKSGGWLLGGRGKVDVWRLAA